MNLPNRELLLFLKVFAFPNASRRGLESRTCFSMVAFASFEALKFFWRRRSSSGPSKLVQALARYERISLVASVLPAPDSPVMITD